jgi:protein-tyrosine phosphatase
MFKVFNQINDWLFVGNIFCLSPDELVSKEISTIICLVEIPTKIREDLTNVGISIKTILFADSEEVDLISYCQEASELISRQRQINKRTLVVCLAGCSRSVSVIIYYLMTHNGLSFGEAYVYVKRKYPEIELNRGFYQKLSLLKTTQTEEQMS